MEINFSTLAVQNPWWSRDWRGRKKRSNSGLPYDPVLFEYEEGDLKWRPLVLKEFDLTKDNIYFLEGPPGVGKSTAVKLLIKDLVVVKKVDPDNVLYYSCGNFYTFEQLNETIKVFLSWRRSKDKVGRLYIFLDEIEFVRNWDKGIKHLRTAGRLKSVSIVITGLNYGKKRTADSMIENKIISTLDFPAFLGLANPLLRNISQRDYPAHAQNLDYYLDIYFLTGGYLSAIRSYKKNGAVSQSVYNNYLSWLMYDLTRLGRDAILFQQILEQLLSNIGQSVGYQTIARKTKAKTHQTIAEYLEILESLFFIKAVYQLSESSDPASRKAKKLYFYDTFLYSLVHAFAQGSLNYWEFNRERLIEGDYHLRLLENIVLNHLNRLDSRNVFFWRDNIKKIGIDFILKSGKKTIPILIRYDRETTAADRKIFVTAGFKQGVIISRDRLEMDKKFKVIPLTYFLLYYRDLLK